MCVVKKVSGEIVFLIHMTVFMAVVFAGAWLRKVAPASIWSPILAALAIGYVVTNLIVALRIILHR